MGREKEGIDRGREGDRQAEEKHGERALNIAQEREEEDT